MIRKKELINELRKLGKPQACSVPRPETTVEDYMKRERPEKLKDYGIDLTKIFSYIPFGNNIIRHSSEGTRSYTPSQNSDRLLPEEGKSPAIWSKRKKFLETVEEELCRDSNRYRETKGKKPEHVELDLRIDSEFLIDEFLSHEANTSDLEFLLHEANTAYPKFSEEGKQGKVEGVG